MRKQRTSSRTKARSKRERTPLKRQVDALFKLHRSEAFRRGDFAGELQDIALAAVDALRVDRVSIWRISADRKRLYCLEVSGKLSSKLRDMTLNFNLCPEYLRALDEDLAIVAPKVSGDKRLKELWENYFRPHNVQATLDAPVRVDGNVAGVVCSEVIGRTRRWTLQEKSFAGNIAELVANAFIGYRAKEQLQELTLELERRVHERTAQLATMNEQLQNEIAERERAQVTLQQSQERLRISERLAAIGTLAAGIAHEINNPLGSIIMSADHALERANDPAHVRNAVEDIRSDAKRCGRIVRSILKFSREGAPDKWPCDLNEILQRVRDLTRQYALDADIHVDLQLNGHPVPIQANPTEIEQVFVNIVRNAIEHSPRGERVCVKTAKENGRTRAMVEDFGDGMSREEQSRIFDPFFTTRLDQGGTGLGLSVSHGIIVAHGGTIEVESEEGRGTVVTVLLPGA